VTRPFSGAVSFRIVVGRIALGVLGPLLVATALAAQGGGSPVHARLEGDWQAKTDDGIRHIMVRPDSSAQFGDEVARWRLVGDSLWLTLGDGEWMVYHLVLEKDHLTISGGDLHKPVTLRRVGPPRPRPDTLTIPVAPPDTARAWD
jgi:hypothetical protein